MHVRDPDNDGKQQELDTNQIGNEKKDIFGLSSSEVDSFLRVHMTDGLRSFAPTGGLRRRRHVEEGLLLGE